MSKLAAPKLSQADKQRIVRAIGLAERGHRGEIQVYLEPRYTGLGPVARAAQLFESLGLDKTREGTGVLLYVATADHRVAVWAGPGIFAAREPGFWREVCRTVADGYRAGQPVMGIEAALDTIRGLLEVAVPGPDGANEHPNRVYDR